MRRLTPILILLVSVMFLSASPAASRWWNDSLVTINGTPYTNEDFKRWWKFMNDADLALPKTPEPYIDWLLLVREGKSMKLDGDPNFQHKTDVFLKFRSLMMLQQDEIFGRINITDGDLQARYEKFYTPLWLLDRLQFKDEDTAQTARRRLMDGTLTIDELVKLPQEDGGPMEFREDWRRPLGIAKEWADIFRKMEVGEVTEPIKDFDALYVYFLKEKKDGDPQDFDKLKERMRDEVSREMKARLTLELLSKLRTKFDVKVDQQRLADLDLNAPDDTYTDNPIISTNRRNVTEKEFVAVARRDQEARKKANHEGNPETEAEETKNRTVQGIISQNLTDWEALDRHYEEKEPLKWEYEFNINHRLTTALEKRLFASKVTVTAAEIEKEYTENISRYSQPESVDIGLIEDIDGVADRIWAEVAAGKDFFKAARENTEKNAPVESIPFAHLDQSVQDVLDGLAKGETSRPFVSKGHRFIVYLQNRVPSKPIPLERVAESIRSRLLQEKIAQKRKAYLDLLKSGAEISVNESQWKAVQKEIGEAQ
jgi:hypothetical protein